MQKAASTDSQANWCLLKKIIHAQTRDCQYYVPASSSNDASCCRSPPVDCKMGEWGLDRSVAQEAIQARRLGRGEFWSAIPFTARHAVESKRHANVDKTCRDNGFRSAYDCATCVLKDSKHAKEKCADSRGLLFVNDCSGMNDACRACLRGGGR